MREPSERDPIQEGASMRQHKHEGCSVREHRNTCAKRSTRAQRAKACKLSLPRVGVRG